MAFGYSPNTKEVKASLHRHMVRAVRQVVPTAERFEIGALLPNRLDVCASELAQAGAIAAAGNWGRDTSPLSTGIRRRFFRRSSGVQSGQVSHVIVEAGFLRAHVSASRGPRP